MTISIIKQSYSASLLRQHFASASITADAILVPQPVTGANDSRVSGDIGSQTRSS